MSVVSAAIVIPVLAAPVCFGLAFGACATVSRSIPAIPSDHGSSESETYSLYLAAREKQAQGRNEEALDLYAQLVEIQPDSFDLWVEYGQTAARAGDLETAERAYSEAVRLEPENIESRLMLAQLFAFSGRWKEAAESYARVKVLDPDYPEIDLLIASAHLEGANLDGAEEALTRLSEQKRDDPALLYYVARLKRLRGKTSESEELFLRALEKSPQSQDLRWELAKLYHETGRPSESLRLLHQLLLQNPDHDGARTLLWRSVWQSRQWADAETVLGQLQVLNPLDPFFPLALGWVFFEQNRMDEALQSFRICLNLVPAYDDALYGAAIVLEAMKADSEAAAMLDRITPDSKLYTDATVRLAFIEARGKEWTKALERIKKLSRRNPEEYRYHEALGLIYQDQHKYREAAVALRKASGLAPDNENVLYELGVATEQAGERKESLDVMKQILVKNPTHASALNWVGYSYAEMGDRLDEAEALVRRAIELKPEDGYFIDSLGWVLFQRGDFPLALETLLHAAELTPDDPVIHEHLADTYLNLGRAADARASYGKALERSPKPDQEERVRQKMGLVGDQP